LLTFDFQAPRGLQGIYHSATNGRWQEANSAGSALLGPLRIDIQLKRQNAYIRMPVAIQVISAAIGEICRTFF
jgi:hypothetical protein